MSAIFLKFIIQLKWNCNNRQICVHTPRKPKLYVAMADASSTFTAWGYVRPVVFIEKKLVCVIN